MSDAPSFLKCADGTQLAYHKTKGRSPVVVFCGGLMSDMTGTKATTLETFCREEGQAYIRFDYYGHGQSDGAFVDGTIGRWAEDVGEILDRLTEGPVVLVGSSMGGWASLLAAIKRPTIIAGWLGIAPAPDFTKDLIWEAYSDEIRQTLKREGVYYEPSEYSDEPYAISMKLIKDGFDHLLLEGPIELNCPIRLLHGLKDIDVPVRKSHEICEQITSDDVVMTFVKNADHRMSTPADLNRMIKLVKELCHYPAR